MSVALEATFDQLVTRFTAMREVLQSLSLMVIEDRPPQGELMLVDGLGNLVEELRGWTEEGYTAALQARQAVSHPPDLHRARFALSVSNERFNELKYRFHEEAVAHHRIGELIRLRNRRGPEWPGWSTSVVHSLNACRVPLRALDESLLHTWQELTERLILRSLSVQTTNIGQQISPAAMSPQHAARRPAGRVEPSHVEDEFT
jgi:hypothetical protein